MLTFVSVAPQPTRLAVRAGTWYPASPRELAADVDRYLAQVSTRVGGLLSGLVAPHAGLRYSGPIAAYAYAQVIGRTYDAVVLMGPSHVEAFRGVALVRRGQFATPLGALSIADGVADALAATCDVIVERPSAHDREHALELQLPFLARLLPDTPIVPLIMGDQHPRVTHALASSLAALQSQWRILIVASTDLSHYLPASVAAARDGVITDALARCDPDAIERALATWPDHACGGGAVVAMMRACREAGATDGRLLAYGDSGQVSGDTSAVVGYAAAAVGCFSPPGT